MIYKLIEYFSGFEGFRDKKITADYENFDKDTVVFKPIPCEEVIKKYTDGEKILQYIFSINFKTDYRISESKAHLSTELLKKYIKENEFSQDGALYFEILEYCNFKRASANLAEYQIKLRFIYERKE